MTTTTNSVSNNPEKIALVEKLIQSKKITLQEGLLLLQEVVTTVSQDWNYPYWNPNNPIIYSTPPTYTTGAYSSEGIGINLEHKD